MPRLRIEARDLQPGDICVGSGALIVSGPSRGTRTPASKVELVVRYPERREPFGEIEYGPPRKACWGRYTELTVARKPELSNP